MADVAMEGFIAENGVKTLSPEASDAIFHYNAVRCGVCAPRLPSASALEDSDIRRISILNPTDATAGRAEAVSAAEALAQRPALL